MPQDSYIQKVVCARISQCFVELGEMVQIIAPNISRLPGRAVIGMMLCSLILLLDHVRQRL